MFKKIKSIRIRFFNILRGIYTRLAITLKIEHQTLDAKLYHHPLKKSPLVRHNRILPKIIWIYWNSNPPDIVNYCVKLVQKLHPDWEVNFLDSETVNNFINIDFQKIKAVSPQQQSDAIRLELLEQYGGIWLDASVILFSSFDTVKDLIEKNQVDLLGFYREVNLIDRNSPVMENWFIVAFKHSPAIVAWKNEFYSALGAGVQRYVDNTRKINPKALANLYNPYYLVCYIAFQNSLKDITSYLFFDCDKSAFLYHTTGGLRNTLFKRNKWGKYNLIRNVFLNKAPKTLPDMIKLTSSDREIFDRYLSKRKFTSSSMASYIDRFLNT